MSADTSDITLTLVRRDGIDCVEFPSLRLRLTSIDGQVFEEDLGLSPLRVGTAPGCALRVRDPRVSREHCELSRGALGVCVRDLGSKNGTFLEGARILEAVLRPGARLRLGSSELTLELGPGLTALPLSSTAQFGEAFGSSVAMRALFAQLEKVARGTEPLLLSGAAGSGKSLLAQAVHAQSARHAGPLVTVECGALSPSLAEAELFGHVRGAFTGAEADRVGLLAQADGGTLILDAIDELPLPQQPLLLRALEARQLRPVGSQSWQAFDVRVIAVTHRDLQTLVAAKAFREDLYYRLAVVELRVPSLRERTEEIPALVARFLGESHPPRTLGSLPAGLLDMLQAHDWPGNVRELRNVVARLGIFPELGPEVLGLKLRASAGENPLLALPLSEAREAVVQQFEREYLSAQLRAARGNVADTAKAMGVSRALAYRLLDRYGLKRSS